MAGQNCPKLERLPKPTRSKLGPIDQDNTELPCLRTSARYHLMTLMLLLTAWMSTVRGRPNSPIGPDDTSPELIGVSEWEPLTRPQYGPASTKSVGSTTTLDRWNWSWRISSRLTDSFHVHHFHKLYFLNDSTALCNDGSPAGYYYRPSKKQNSQNWLIFLEGGWYCFDNETCRLRESSTFALFSSASWPMNRAFDGILSAYANINPIYHEYHNVFIPYCSSDLWTGKKPNPSGEFYFHGSRILQAVIDHLPWPKTTRVERVIFAGSSAGGIGVLMNVDRLSRRLVHRLGYPLLVSGIVDSAWFIHTPAYRVAKCSNVFECPAEEGIHRGMRFWKARIPKRCRKQQPRGERWRCYLAPFMYEHLKTPVYIVQSLFDEAQMQMSKVTLLTGGTYEKWAYIQKLGRQVAQSLQNIKGVFAPSCIDHEILTKNNWVHKAIGTVGLVDALQAWDRQLVREWTRKKMILWSFRYPQSLFGLRDHYQPIASHEESDSGQPTNVKFTRNSTLLFLSRLVSMLNQRARRRRDLNAQPPMTNSVREVFDFRETQPIRLRSMRHSKDGYHASSPTALTMTKQPNLSPNALSYNPYTHYLNRLPAARLPSYLTANDYNLYHVIDSCGLVSGHSDRGGYLCRSAEPVNRTAHDEAMPDAQTTPAPPDFDHLIPQCNPTCGFLSNPHRMKLVDVLALYEVNTDLLAKILGLTTAELRSLDSEQQMRMLFCGNHRLTRRTRGNQPVDRASQARSTHPLLR